MISTFALDGRWTGRLAAIIQLPLVLSPQNQNPRLATTERQRQRQRVRGLPPPDASTSSGPHPAPQRRARVCPCRLDRLRERGLPPNGVLRPRCGSNEVVLPCSRHMRPSTCKRSPRHRSTRLPLPLRDPPARTQPASQAAPSSAEKGRGDSSRVRAQSLHIPYHPIASTASAPGP